MKSSTPKVLHRVAGRSLVAHAIAAAAGVEPDRVVVVVRHDRDTVAHHISEIASEALIADQDDVPGTGRAVYCGLSMLDETIKAGLVAEGATKAKNVRKAGATGTVLVTSGDVPLIAAGTLRELAAAHAADGNAVTVLTATIDKPTGYGRIIRDASSGEVLEIVEEADATEAQREIAEINTGIYAFDADALREALAQLRQDNDQGEMYLTDVIRLAREANGKVRAIMTDDPTEAEGINDKVQLAVAAALLNRSIVEKWMRAGVTIVDPSTTWIDADVTLAPDVTILPGTQLHGATAIATGATVGPDTTLDSVTVGEGATVIRTHGSDSVIGQGAIVGPFAYLRPGTILGDAAKIGTFVETKNARIGDGAKVPHLSYVGDATVGEGSNIGAATIFVNYDGVTKSHTTVGKHVKIGSDNMLVAPVSVGDGAYTGAGSVIRDDVPPGALGINTAPQRNIAGWVERRRPGTPSALAAAAASDGVAAPEALSSQAKKELAAAEQVDDQGE